MKILSVNNTADIYGASRCLERVLGRFAEDGHEVHVVVPGPGPLVDLLQSRGVVVHIHPTLPTIDRVQLSTVQGGLRFVVQFPWSVLWLARLILRLKVEVVHTNTVVMPTPALAAVLTGRRHVWHIRELLAEFGALWRPYQRYVYFLSSVIVAISACVKDQFEPSLRDKIRVVYDGIDEKDRKLNPVRSTEFREQFPGASRIVGVVGRIKFHRKGQEILVKAAALLKEKYPDVKYVVIGTAAPGNEVHVERLRALIAEHKLEHSVSLLGDIQGLAPIFAAMDIAVVPSVQAEPFGCVVMEAMAVGTPVVGSRCGGIAEQIVDGETGILFPPGDEVALAAALDRLLGDADLRQTMGAHAALHVQSNFNLDTTCSDMAASLAA